MQTPLSTKFRQMRSQLADRYLAFKPSIDTLRIAGHDIRFLFATPQAAEWYRPLAPHLLAEFDWVAARIGGRPERIVDAGAYHGLYSLVFGAAAGPGSAIAIVDPVPSNCAIIEANLALNRIEARIVEAAVSERDGPVSFTAESCGRIDRAGSVTCRGLTLPGIMADATIAKIDIEGAEANVLPAQIDSMPSVHTWIVELHPDFGVDAAAIVRLFADRKFDLHYLDRDAARVVALDPAAPWSGRTAFMAIRPR